MTSSWFFLSTLNYDARSTTHQIYRLFVCHSITEKTLQHNTRLFRSPQANAVTTDLPRGMELILVNKHYTCQSRSVRHLRPVFPKYLLRMHDVTHNDVREPAQFEYCKRAITSVCVAPCKRAMCNLWLHLRTDFRGLGTNDTGISFTYSAIVLSP